MTFMFIDFTHPCCLNCAAHRKKLIVKLINTLVILSSKTYVFEDKMTKQ